MSESRWDKGWILEEIVSQFDLAPAQSIQSVGSGHINDSYQVITDKGNVFLQRINHLVFLPVKELMRNMEQLLELMHRSSDSNCPQLIRTRSGENMVYNESTDSYWRMTTFIPGVSMANTTDLNIAREAGKAIAVFHQKTKPLDPANFYPVIPDFHDMFWRYEQFYNACAEDVANRLMGVLPLVDWVESMEDEMTALPTEVLQHRIPIQVVHNDTKLENILFDEKQEVICLIDLDTVMPGTILYDIGDALRTLPVNLPEDAENVENLEISMAITRAFIEGYLTIQYDKLNDYELKWLPFAAPYMTFIMGIRFLTDYLAGDVYYKTQKDKHNLFRARNQFALVKKWLELQPELKTFIQDHVTQNVKSTQQS